MKYEHRTSRAGDPHVHSHVLLANKQLCQDGKVRTLDGVSLYHEARAAGMVYQATVREILSRKLGVEFGDVVNGCAEIVGLDDPELLESYSTRGQVPCSGVAVCAFGSVFSSVFEVRRLAGCGHHWRLLCGA